MRGGKGRSVGMARSMYTVLKAIFAQLYKLHQAGVWSTAAGIGRHIATAVGPCV